MASNLHYVAFSSCSVFVEVWNPKATFLIVLSVSLSVQAGGIIPLKMLWVFYKLYWNSLKKYTHTLPWDKPLSITGHLGDHCEITSLSLLEIFLSKKKGLQIIPLNLVIIYKEVFIPTLNFFLYPKITFYFENILL